MIYRENANKKTTPSEMSKRKKSCPAVYSAFYRLLFKSVLCVPCKLAPLPPLPAMLIELLLNMKLLPMLDADGLFALLLLESDAADTISDAAELKSFFLARV